MAALRLFTRSRVLTIILRDSGQFKSSDTLPNIVQVIKRWGTYSKSPLYEDPSRYTEYEVTKDPEEWKYVTALLRNKTIPKPSLEDKEYPSGWKPPVAKPRQHPYHVQRSKNYLLPVYLNLTYRGTRKITSIRKIHGDIWTLRSELQKYIHESVQKPIGVRVNELTGKIEFKGDYVNLVKKWLLEKGF